MALRFSYQGLRLWQDQSPYLNASSSYDSSKSITADNHPAKTLILDGADVEVTSGDGIKLPDGATIVVKSASTAATSDSNATTVEGVGALTITGSGKFTVNGTGAYSNTQAGVKPGSAGIGAVGNLMLTNANIDAQGTSGGIYSDKNILIDGGTVNAVGTGTTDSEPDGLDADNITIKGGAYGTASGVYAAILCEGEDPDGTLTLENDPITVPAGSKFDGTKDAVVDSTGKIATSVTIGVKPDNPAIPTPTTPPTTSTATSTVVVDGKTTDAGKVTTTTNADGTKNNVVAVDPTTLEKQVAAADKGSSVVVTVPDSTGTASAQLVVKDVETLNAKEMSLEIKTGSTTYTVAPNAIDTAKVAAALGAADTTKVPLTVTVTPLKQSDVKVAEGTQIANPVKFEVTATYNGKTTEISTFDSYVSRDIAIPDGVDPSKITTGIRIEDGEHVPTFVYQQGGKYFAKISSLTNSTYTVVYNEKSFADTTGKWYEKAVTEMVSREVINVKTATTFAGDSSITRAEFAAILARALGLPEGGTNSFSDVASDAWCYGAVGAAVKYGIINGYTDGSFKPGKNITREEAMAMMQRAAKVTGYAGTTGALTGFSDASSVGSWAKSAVTFNVGSGLIQGNAGKLNPKSNITRAETAVVVLRLLQKSTLVDVRTNA